MTLAYNKQIHWLTSATSSSLVLTLQPHGPAIFHNSSVLETDAYYATRSQVLQTKWLALIKAPQAHVKKRLDSAQKKYKRDYGTKLNSASTSYPVQMVFVDKPALNASFADIAERLAKTSYKKSMRKVMGPLAIISAQSKILIIDEHSFHIMVSIDLATLTPGNKPPTNASQRFQAEKDPLTDLVANRQNTQTALNKYASDQIVSHKGSGDDLCHQVAGTDHHQSMTL